MNLVVTMIDKYHKVVLYNLEKFSIPYYLKTRLEKKYNPSYFTEEDNVKARRIDEEIRTRKDSKIKHVPKPLNHLQRL